MEWAWANKRFDRFLCPPVKAKGRLDQSTALNDPDVVWPCSEGLILETCVKIGGSRISDCSSSSGRRLRPPAPTAAAQNSRECVFFFFNLDS